ncbi:MAG TPA: hypothetical protein VGO40_21750 [Longimicrobium sp.]|jgi:hypothetical protein|nr:hypothetical protein [Longimicrobium sp.]
MRIAARPRRSTAVSTPPRPQRRALAARAVLLALALSACSEPPPAERAADAVESIRSWTATVRLAAESWLQAKTPAAYTRLTLRKGKQTLGDAVETLEAGPVPPEVEANLGMLRAPAASARRLAEAAERGDRGAVRRELAALAAVEARIRALDERLAAAEAKP